MVSRAVPSGPSTDPGTAPAPAEALRLRRLLPDPSTLTPGEAAAGLRLGDLAPPDRPYVVLNMVATLDGRAALEGRTAGLGSPADRELFHELRTQADAVMAGAGTLRVERYGRIVRDPARREKRRREGLAPDPLAIVVSASLDGLSQLPLLAVAEQPVVVLTGAEGQIAPSETPVEYVRTPKPAGSGSAADLGAALRRLRAEHGVRSILCEGGPRLNAELLRADLVDEIFLSIAPKLVGGGDPLTIVGGSALAEPAELDLVWVLEREGELYLRLRVSRHARALGEAGASA